MRKLKSIPALASMSPVYPHKVQILKERASLLMKARLFFSNRNIMEVDCPILSTNASIDPHIDLISALYKGNTVHYLHSSPEYGMKRLLSIGVGDIYQLSHVFRDEEEGQKHNPEFMMAEWYRLGFSLEQMIDETVDFVRLFLGNLPYQTISYREAFKQHLNIDYCTMNEQELFDYIESSGIPFYPSLKNEGKDAMLNLILGLLIEPNLGKNEICVLAYYPASQAALAQKRCHGEEMVAERFEVYYQGVELANGYHELADAKEQRDRLIEANMMRKALSKNALPLDENFLNALSHGLPDCSGVAVGFDRLMMLRSKCDSIADVLAWGWQEA